MIINGGIYVLSKFDSRGLSFELVQAIRSFGWTNLNIIQQEITLRSGVEFLPRIFTRLTWIREKLLFSEITWWNWDERNEKLAGVQRHMRLTWGKIRSVFRSLAKQNVRVCVLVDCQDRSIARIIEHERS